MRGFPVRGIREAINLAITYARPNNLVLICVTHLGLMYAGQIIETEKCGAPRNRALLKSLLMKPKRKRGSSYPAIQK